jgi:hypothetical protein
MILQREVDTFQRELPRLLEAGEQGRYVLIRGDEVVSVWDTRRDALQVGHERFGEVPFLIKQILKEERPIFIRPLMVPHADHQRTDNE